MQLIFTFYHNKNDNKQAHDLHKFVSRKRRGKRMSRRKILIKFRPTNENIIQPK